MAETYDLIVRGGTLATPAGIAPGDVAVRDGRIVAIGALGTASASDEIDARGLHVLPGVIDTQVHFREPGNEHKEDLETGSRAAVAGGVTAVFEMPNTSPTTTTAEAIADKVRRGTGRMFCDFAFYVGASADNADRLHELERLPGTCGIKIFMGSSTGTLLVPDDDTLRRALASGRRRVAVHAEDEQRLIERKPLSAEGGVRQHPVWRDVESAVRATERIVRLARETGRRVHVLHITTAEEIRMLGAVKDLITVEVTPQHLTLRAPDAYDALGTLAQMNPPIRGGQHREGLWAGVAQGIVDVIGSDHAPHTREEKAAAYPASPSGMPGVQTLVPVMLDHVATGRLSLERFVDLTSHGAARLFGLAGKGRLAVGYDADLTIVDLKAEREITDAWIESRCGWTPFAGRRVTGWPIGTIVRGRKVMWDGDIIGPAHGKPVRFLDTFTA